MLSRSHAHHSGHLSRAWKWGLWWNCPRCQRMALWQIFAIDSRLQMKRKTHLAGFSRWLCTSPKSLVPITPLKQPKNKRMPGWQLWQLTICYQWSAYICKHLRSFNASYVRRSVSEWSEWKANESWGRVKQKTHIFCSVSAYIKSASLRDTK